MYESAHINIERLFSTSEAHEYGSELKNVF